VTRAIPEQLPDAKISMEIRQPAQRTPDDRKAAEHLAEARNWFARPNSRADALYQAHRNYKLAMAYLGAATLPEDQLQYDAAEKRLIDTLIEKYRRAYAMVLNKQWNDAEKLLREITDMYPDTTSDLYGSAQDLIRYILAQKPKRNQFR
jgi:TolA-binding protein